MFIYRLNYTKSIVGQKLKDVLLLSESYPMYKCHVKKKGGVPLPTVTRFAADPHELGHRGGSIPMPPQMLDVVREDFWNYAFLKSRTSKGVC